ncbi:MAG: hypothetical protein E7592_00645 [Ruminococcaceae bacterium]|nr:hypothetical protein [Oscillospiraceae bacterium]
MKLKLKVLALILAALSVFSVFAACDASGTSENTTTSAGNGYETTEPTEGQTAEQTAEQTTGQASEQTTGQTSEQTTEVTPDVPDIEKKNYDDIFYLYLEGSCNPIDNYWVEESGNDVLSAALFARQEDILNHLGVELYAWHNTEEDYSSAFKTAVKTKSGAIDLMMTHVSINVAGLVSDGYLTKFNDIPEIDLDADYWNQDFMESLAIDDMYFLGFNDFNILYTYVIAFNKTLLEKYDDVLDKSIYQMVDDHEWTIDKMIDLAKVAYIDNGSVEKNQYGFTGLQWVPWCGFLEGCGINLVEMNDQGNYEVSFYNAQTKDKTIALVGKLKDLAASDYACVDYWSFEITVPFTTNRALMTLSSTNQLTEYLHYDIDFGIVPYPLFDSNQTEYHSLQWGGYLAIPAYFEDEEMVGETIEMLAYYSDGVKVAFYQKLLGKQVADNPDDRHMLEIVWDSVCTDFGQTFENASNDMLYMLPYVTSATSGYELTSYYDSNAQSANKSLENFVKRVVKKNK